MADRLPLGAAVADAMSRLSPCSNPRLEAEHLVLGVTGRSRTALYVHGDTELSPEEQALLDQWIQRRIGGEPLAYILGEREFYGLNFQVSPAVLIPRPDTETLVDQALNLIPVDARWRIADLGTGSGCIALALAHQRPGCSLVASDASTDALQLARSNARKLGISNVEFVTSHWLDQLDGQFEMVVSNPPYIDGDSPYLHQGDLPSEPREALTPGDDGLLAIQEIISTAPERLTQSAWLLLEHGFDQGQAVRELLGTGGFKDVKTHADLTGQDRCSRGQWPGL